MSPLRVFLLLVPLSLGLALPTLWLVFPFALVSYAIGGLAHGLKNVLIRTLIHELTQSPLFQTR